MAKQDAHINDVSERDGCSAPERAKFDDAAPGLDSIRSRVVARLLFEQTHMQSVSQATFWQESRGTPQ